MPLERNTAGPPWHPRGPADVGREGWLTGSDENELNLTEYINLVWGHRWIVLVVMAVTVVSVMAWTITRPKMFRSTASIAIRSEPQLSSTQAFGSSWWEMERYIKNQVQILRTERLAERVAERLGLADQPGFGSNAARRLLGMIDVEPVRETDVIEISLIGPEPERVSEWLNVYVDEFIKLNIEDNLFRSRQVFEVIQRRLDPLRDKLDESERRLTEYREREGALLFSDEDKNVITEQVNTLTTEYAQAKAERINLETTLNALRRLGRTSDIGQESFPEILDDETIRSMTAQRNQLNVELGDKRRTYKEGHPVIKELRSKLKGIDDQIKAQIATITTSLQTDFDIARQRESSLYDNIQQLKQQSIELGRQTMEYDRLRREYDQNNAFFEEMLARSKEMHLSSEATVNNFRIIDPARPARGPYSPKVSRSLALSVILGLALGVGLVFGLELLDQTLRTPEDVERCTGLDVLSALPKFSEDKARVLREAFQSLRTALILAARGEGAQIVMVTSAAPSEGKTTVAFNLAKVLATGGQRVLMIDGDLRKPRLHRLIQTKNRRGLTSVVLGESEIGDVIHVLAEIPNLDLVTTGPLPPNPPELFGKESFRKQLAMARATYDWVIIDSPPVISVTDPVICAQHVDMVLLVVEYGRTKRQVVQQAVRQLARAGVRIAGTLLNKVDVDRDQYYSSYYSYYSYGDEPGSGTRRSGATAGAPVSGGSAGRSTGGLSGAVPGGSSTLPEADLDGSEPSREDGPSRSSIKTSSAAKAG